MPMTSLIQPSKVDWDLVDEELDKVSEEFKDPRFDSLRHVLDILSAVDAEAALEELKGQQEAIEQLVDNVVQGYHSGFNKAIHNYSQILHLFSVSKDQVNKLRSQLEDAQRRLAVQSQITEVQWKRSVTLDDIVKLLGDVKGFVDIPHQVRAAQEAKDWASAASILLDACTWIAQPQYSGIGALKDLKKELGVRRNSLVKAMIAEVEREVYEDLHSRPHAEAATATSSHHFDRQSKGSGHSLSPRSEPSTTPKLEGNGLRRRPSGNNMDQMGAAKNGSTHKIGGPDPALQGNPSTEENCRELVACIVTIGGIDELQTALHRHMPDQIKSVVMRDIKAIGAARAVSISKDTGKSYFIDPAVASASARLVHRVFESCSQVFKNLVSVLRLISRSKEPPSTAGLSLLVAATPPDAQLSLGTGSGYARRELGYAWDCLQKEAQNLLSELLQPGESQGLRDFQTGLAGGEGHKLSFSFDVQLQGVAARSLLKRERTEGKWEGGTMAQLVSAALSGFQGSTYLTAHVYGPTVRQGLEALLTLQFATKILATLSALDKEADSGAWFGAAERNESRLSLYNFLNSFIENAFMPSVFLDFKARSSEILEDQEAFRARAKPQAIYESEASKGRPLLPVVRAIETIVEELLQWARLMPKFGDRLTGILENILGKVLAAFQGRMSDLLGVTACKALSEDSALAVQMAAEPCAPQAGEAVAFFVDSSGEAKDHFLSSILQTGFGTGGEAAELAVLKRLLQLRPVKAPSLLSAGDTYRVTNLAAIADSLDCLADIVQGAILEQGEETTGWAETSITLSNKQRSVEIGQVPASRGNRPMLDGLDDLVDRHRSLAGQSLRALRLDMLLLVVHHLGELAKGNYVCESAEAQDVEECVGALQRSASRTDEDIVPFLPSQKRAYVFGGMAAAAARFVMWLLPEIMAMNQAGLARMCRMLAVLQPFLAGLGATMSMFRPEAARHLEKARAYYAHLTYAPQALIAAALSKPTRFTAKEYLALLEVDFAGRVVTEEQKVELTRAVTGTKKARFQ